jgi:predicted Zn-ribbon and HTH transcriptional regulator
MEESKPKRTRKPRSKGLGDTVEKVTKATGIDKAVKWLVGEDCGCDKRKDKLNNLFPYRQPKCLQEEEHKYLTTFFESKTNTLAPSQQRELLNIYNRVMSTNEQVSSCPDCWRNRIKELKKIYNEY